MNTTTEDPAAQATHVRSDGVRNYLDRLTLDAHLTTLLDTAHLERARGVPAVAPVYLLLHRQATEQVRNYCACRRLEPWRRRGSAHRELLRKADQDA